MVDHARARKMADRIKVVIAERLDRGIKDPRLGFVTITDVQVTGDLQHASVFYTVYGSDQERADTQAALKSATGMLRSEVGKNITARLTPSLEFILDAIPENAQHIEDLLRTARERDAEALKLAQGASYAGDENPYVTDADDEDDDADAAAAPAAAVAPVAADEAGASGDESASAGDDETVSGNEDDTK